jgi:hypothetical protein
MKDCDHIRSMLFTDYVDNELDNNTKRIVEEHLAICHECGHLVSMVKEDMSLISDDGARKKISPYIWQSIVKKIGGEERKTNAAIDFVRTFAERLTFPGLAPALFGMILLVLSISFFLYTQYIRQGYGNANLEYVAELFTNAGSSVITEHEGLGTSIEEYFL